ncbi:MAG: PadR family transcriptional regulator [Acidobacteria bacterium]|nr:PadR family transcriptional regulator [Acidobacteriota bacterium]
MPRRTPRKLLTPAALHILLTLADGDQHGYAIRAAVETRTGGELELGPGTLYEALHRMVESGWIRAVAPDERRKVYALTVAGRAELDDELRRLDAIITYARNNALLPDGTES